MHGINPRTMLIWGGVADGPGLTQSTVVIGERMVCHKISGFSLSDPIKLDMFSRSLI